MDVTSDEIDGLRKTYSDDQILSVLKQHAPADADEIDSLQKKGATATQILSVYPDYAKDKAASTQPKTSGVIGTAMDLGSKAIGALRHGVADEFNREGATSEVLSGTPSVASTIGKAINDPSYDPASNHAGFGSWDAASYIPRAIVESLPSQGGYLAAGAAGGALGSAVPVVGTGIGALLGAGAYGLSRYLGTNAKERAANDGHAGNVTNSDIIGALPGSAGQAALDAVGSRYLAQNALLKAVPVTGAGLDAMKQTGKNILKTAGVDAATSGANAAVGQAGTEIGTQAGYHPDAGQIATSAGIGGLAGFGMKAAGSLTEVGRNIRQTGAERGLDYQLSPDDAALSTQLADLLHGTRVSGDPMNPKDAGTVLKNGKAVVSKDTNDALASLKSDIKTLESAGRKTDAAAATESLNHATDMLTNLRSGPLDPAQIVKTKKMLYDASPDLLDGILKLNEINKLAAQSKISGINDTPENSGSSPVSAYHLNGAARAALHLAGMGVTLSHGNVPLAMALHGLPIINNLLGRAKSTVSGDSTYVRDYVNRFKTDPELATRLQSEQAARDQQAQPQAPQEPQAPITDPRQLLTSQIPQGVHPAHYAVDPNWAPQGPQEQAPDPIHPLQALQSLQPDRITNPKYQIAQNLYTPAPKRGFSDQRGAEIPDNLLMLRAALAKANEAASSDQAPGDPQQAQGAPQGSATPPQTPQGQQSPQGRGKAQKAGEDSSAQKASKDTNAPQAKQSAPQPSFNEQADAIEQSIKQSRDTIADPNSSPGEIAAAKASLRKAALEAAGQHDASAGGARAPKGAKAAGGGGSSSGHAKASSAPKGAHAPEASSGKSEGSAEGASGANGKGGEVFHVQTKHGKVTLHEKSTRRNQEVQAAGIVKRVNTRDEVGRAVSQLPLSAAGHAAAKAKVPELMHNVLHLSSASEAKTALNHFLGSFSGKDHAILGNHFNNFRASSGQNFLGTWKHGDEKMAKAARVKNEAINKGKKTKAANKDAEKK